MSPRRAANGQLQPDQRSVEKTTNFYWMQSVTTLLIKGGISDDVEARRRQHETGSGSVVLLGIIPGVDRAFEQSMFRHAPLARHRLKAHDDGRRPFEVFTPNPEVIAFINGQFMDAEGYRRLLRAIDPAWETTRHWLQRVSKVCGKEAREAAKWNLAEDERLRATVPRSARGGWDLNEIIGGGGKVSRQTVFEFSARLIDRKKWLINLITYRGCPFEYVVFDEMYRREHGNKESPRGAVRADLPYGKPKRPSGRLGTPLRQQRLIYTDPLQVVMFRG